MTGEQRKSPRIPAILDVVIQGREGIAKVIDISESGVFIGLHSIADLRTDDKLSLLLQLPQEPKPFLVQARVARVTEDGIGAEFVSQSHDETEISYLFNVLRYTIPLAQEAACAESEAPAPEHARRPLRRIMAALSFSPAGLAACSAAADLAAASGAKLLVFHATPTADDGKGKAPAALFNEKVRPLLNGVENFEFLCRPGEAAPAILEAAQDLRADLLVLGNPGKAGGLLAGILEKYPGRVMAAPEAK